MYDIQDVIEYLATQGKTTKDISHILHKNRLYIFCGFGGPKCVRGREKTWFHIVFDLREVSFFTFTSHREAINFFKGTIVEIEEPNLDEVENYLKSISAGE